MTVEPVDCGCSSRRGFLADVGMGFTGLALGAMLARDGIVRADDSDWSPPTGKPLGTPKAKSVIWIFLSGGYSHLETFDPKPALNQYAGMTFDKTPFKNPVLSPLHNLRSRSVVAETINKRDVYPTIYPMQVGFKKYGQCGVEVTDWWPHLAGCVDDIAFVRSMYTTDNDHAAEAQIHTGRHKLDDTQPSVGAWLHYGLGSLNENLPSFIVLGDFTSPNISQNFQSEYLGPKHAGIRLSLDPKNPLPFASRGEDVLAQENRMNTTSSTSSTVSRPSSTHKTTSFARGSVRTSWRSGCKWLCPKRSTYRAKRWKHTDSMAWTIPRPERRASGCWPPVVWPSAEYATAWCT